MDTDSPVRLERLTVRYGSFVAVDGLDLAARPGEVFGLIGPNGAGKSSVLRVVVGQRRPDDGRVTIAGLDCIRERFAITPLLGYVPDRENHFDEFSGRWNLRFFAGLFGAPNDRVEECLALVELADAADVPVQGYSLGMRRKLLLARALLHGPRILVLDEPTANLDQHSTALVRRLLRALAAQGATVLLTTHDMDEVQEVCDRVAILNRGRLVALDTPLNLRRRHEDRAADVIRRDGSRQTFDLDRDSDRAALAAEITGGTVDSLQTREFDFRAAFLKLTGSEFT